MGVTNLVRYLKEAKIDIKTNKIPERYHLSVDLATIIVPIMQQSADSKDFVTRLRGYLMQNGQLILLLLNAREVSIHLDMFSPRMKIDTRDNRRYKRYSNEHNTAARSKELPKSNTNNQGHHQHNNEIKHPIQLREIRHLIASTILNAMSEFDQTFAHRCSFDVHRIGEGEVKCMSYNNMCCPSLPNVILSNDNDVLLMILLHESGNRIEENFHSCTAPNYYRVMMYRNHTIRAKGDTLIFHRFELDSIEPYGTDNLCLNVKDRGRWILVVWIICLCGTDFVPAVCTITQNCRKMLLARCIANFKQHQIDIEGYRRFNFDNFFTVMQLFFAIITGKEKNFYNDDGRKKRFTVSMAKNDQVRFSDYAIKRLDKMAKWCARVYWNVLYFIDLPIDFHLKDKRMFDSNHQISVNIYIENESISIWNLVNLPVSHAGYLYRRIKQVCRLHDD